MFRIVASLFVLLALSSVGEARTKYHNADVKPVSVSVNRHYDARPHAWCGWYMRHQVAIDPGPAFNLARNWAHYGAAVTEPIVGAIVVWPHHVGMITGPAINGLWMVHSGNDGHAVRTRARSLSGAIAFRLPPGRSVILLSNLRSDPPPMPERGQET